MSATKAAGIEREVRSMKKALYRYVDDHGQKCIQKLSQFLSFLKSTKKCSIDRIPRNVKIPEFCPFGTGNNHKNLEKPKFKSGDRVRISKYDLPFRKGYKPQFTKEIFETFTIPSKKPPTYTIKDGQVKIKSGIF